MEERISLAHSESGVSRLNRCTKDGETFTSLGIVEVNIHGRPEAIASISAIPSPSEKEVSIKVSKAIKIEGTSRL